MNIPLEALVGGMLLGVSASMLLVFNGKIAGISGVLAGLLKPEKSDSAWRWLFVIGMVSGGGIGVYLLGFDAPTLAETNVWLVAGAGLLVGLGTRLANGCTSGHGICGIGRFSVRSLIATGVFMLVAILTVFFKLHWV